MACHTLTFWRLHAPAYAGALKLGYYRNTMMHVFTEEATCLYALATFGEKAALHDGVSLEVNCASLPFPTSSESLCAIPSNPCCPLRTAYRCCGVRRDFSARHSQMTSWNCARRPLRRCVLCSWPTTREHLLPTHALRSNYVMTCTRHACALSFADRLAGIFATQAAEHVDRTLELLVERGVLQYKQTSSGAATVVALDRRMLCFQVALLKSFVQCVWFVSGLTQRMLDELPEGETLAEKPFVKLVRSSGTAPQCQLHHQRDACLAPFIVQRSRRCAT